MNIHYVLNKFTVHKAVERLETHGFPEGIKAIVFLLHKPVGLGKKENIITADHVEFQRLLQLAVSGKTSYKIGFDMETTGKCIRRLMNQRKFTVKDVQKYHMSFYDETFCSRVYVYYREVKRLSYL